MHEECARHWLHLGLYFDLVYAATARSGFAHNLWLAANNPQKEIVRTYHLLGAGWRLRTQAFRLATVVGKFVATPLCPRKGPGRDAEVGGFGAQSNQVCRGQTIWAQTQNLLVPGTVKQGQQGQQSQQSQHVTEDQAESQQKVNKIPKARGGGERNSIAPL
jgi:hypothetical protein